MIAAAAMKPRTFFPSLLVALALPAGAASSATGAATGRPSDEQEAMAIHDAAAPSVVQLEANWTVLAPKKTGIAIPGFEEFAPKMPKVPTPHHVVGTGFAWDDAGHIVTTDAVISEKDAVVSVILADGSRRSARVLGHDAGVDIAVLQLEGTPGRLRPLPMAAHAPRIGARVYAFVNTYGQGLDYVTGMVAGLDRQIEGAGGRAIVLNMLTSPGDAGGPVLDTSGHLVGMMTAVYGRTTFPGFDIASYAEDLARYVPRLIADGRIDHPGLGVLVAQAKDVPPGVPAGLPVDRLQPGHSGERAGLRARDGAAIDVITAIDGAPLRSASDLRRLLDAHRPGDECTLTVWREGTTRTLTATLDAGPAAAPAVSPPASAARSEPAP